MWGHEYVITSLLENVVSWKINEGGRRSEAYPQSTLIHGHALCLSGRRPSSAVHHFGRRGESKPKQVYAGMQFFVSEQ